MMNIEPGCIAMIVASSVTGNIGKTVQVIEYVGSLSPLVFGVNYWRIEKDKNILSVDGNPVAYYNEPSLMRVDGFKENKLIKAEELEPVY